MTPRPAKAQPGGDGRLCATILVPDTCWGSGCHPLNPRLTGSAVADLRQLILLPRRYVFLAGETARAITRTDFPPA